MDEPRNAENEPTETPDVEPDDATTTPDPDRATDSTPEDAPAIAPEPASTVPRGRQAIFIAAALVIALAVGGGLALAFRDGGDAGPASDEEQAKAAAVALLEGTYKSARGDASGCRAMTDNVILQPEQTDFYDRCVEQTNQAGGINEALVIDEVKATKVTLDLAAGTGTVEVDVTATANGETETKSAPVPVKKVDGTWKVNPLG